MPRGTITAYDEKHASGTVTLETGDVVHFDASVATATPHQGQAGEVVTGIGRGGQLVARLVLLDQPDDTSAPLADGLLALKTAGLLRELTDAEAKAAVGEGPLTRQRAGTLIEQYYGLGSPSARAKADRLLCLDEHFGDSPKLPVNDLVALAPGAHHAALAQALDGLHPLSLGAVLSAFNGVLQRAGEALHYYLLDADSDRFAIVTLREDAFGKAAHATVLRVVS